ncbi:hypothetical protein [Arthrobacter silvisoli]|uniref:hypothetical protein n=1 Tax=Arthrobacter silvisoli TaxID=2291022 RepID=UPI0014447076|nr:hypothetical protein [Arthrobacter silvisoli]
MEDRRNPEEEAGGYGTPTVEQEMGGEQSAQPRPGQGGAGQGGAGQEGAGQEGAGQDSAEPDVDLPSAEAPMDAGNTDADPKPDGGASGLPAEKSPRDDEDEDERFDAG